MSVSDVVRPHEGLLCPEEVDALENLVHAARQGWLRPAVDPAEALVGYVPGAWDMFHIGHLNLLRRARRRCDVLVVGVATDEAIQRAKDKLPVIPLEDRMQIVASLGIVDEVVVDQGSKIEVHQRHPFDVLFKGNDWQGTPKGDRLLADMASVGVRVDFMSYTPHISSTLLRSVITAL